VLKRNKPVAPDLPGALTPAKDEKLKTLLKQAIRNLFCEIHINYSTNNTEICIIIV